MWWHFATISITIMHLAIAMLAAHRSHAARRWFPRRSIHPIIVLTTTATVPIVPLSLHRSFVVASGVFVVTSASVPIAISVPITLISVSVPIATAIPVTIPSVSIAITIHHTATATAAATSALVLFVVESSKNVTIVLPALIASRRSEPRRNVQIAGNVDLLGINLQLLLLSVVSSVRNLLESIVVGLHPTALHRSLVAAPSERTLIIATAGSHRSGHLGTTLHITPAASAHVSPSGKIAHVDLKLLSLGFLLDLGHRLRIEILPPWLPSVPTKIDHILNHEPNSAADSVFIFVPNDLAHLVKVWAQVLGVLFLHFGADGGQKLAQAFQRLLVVVPAVFLDQQLDTAVHDTGG